MSDTTDKLGVVKTYLLGLPDKFKALQDKIDLLAANDAADASKISELQSDKDSLTAEHDTISTLVDELVASKDAADLADGPDV